MEAERHLYFVSEIPVAASYWIFLSNNENKTNLKTFTSLKLLCVRQSLKLIQFSIVHVKLNYIHIDKREKKTHTHKYTYKYSHSNNKKKIEMKKKNVLNVCFFSRNNALINLSSLGYCDKRNRYMVKLSQKHSYLIFHVN